MRSRNWNNSRGRAASWLRQVPPAHPANEHFLSHSVDSPSPLMFCHYFCCFLGVSRTPCRSDLAWTGTRGGPVVKPTAAAAAAAAALREAEKTLSSFPTVVLFCALRRPAFPRECLRDGEVFFFLWETDRCEGFLRGTRLG